MWIARDKDGWLTIFEEELVKDKENGCWIPSAPGSKYENLCDVDFPEVTWENSPVRIKLVIDDEKVGSV